MKSALRKLKQPLFESPFPQLSKVLQEFCEKNRLKKPAHVTCVDDTLIAIWPNFDSVVLLERDGRVASLAELEPYIGGDGTHRHRQSERIYELKGRLKSEKVKLRAKFCYSEDYKMREAGDGVDFRIVPESTGQTRTTILRDDDSGYWFLRAGRN